MPNVVKLILQTIDMMTAVVRPFVFSARACAITSNNFSSSELNREPTTTIFNRINDTSNNPSQLNTATPNGNNLPASSTTDCNTSDIKVSNPNPPNTKAAASSTGAHQSLPEASPPNQKIQPTADAISETKNAPVAALTANLDTNENVVSTTNITQATTRSNPMNFRTENIGAWAAQQENYFARQNRERLLESERKLATWHKYRPIVVITACAIFFSLEIWGIISILIAMLDRPTEIDLTPTIAGGSSQDIIDYTNYLEKIHDENPGNPDIVEDTVSNTLETENGKEYNTQVQLAQLNLYWRNNQCQQVVDVSKNINESEINSNLLGAYYNVVALCYDEIGQSTEAATYFVKSLEATEELIKDGYGE